MTSSQTKTIPEFLAEAPDVDSRELWQAFWEILTAAKDKITAELPVQPHPNSDGLAAWSTPDDSYEGSLNTYAGDPDPYKSDDEDAETVETELLLADLEQHGLADNTLVILTSDNAYFSDNVTKNLLPDISLAYNPTGILNAYEYIRMMQGRENASFMTAHDPDGPAGKARTGTPARSRIRRRL